MKKRKIKKLKQQTVSIGLAAVLAFSGIGNVVWAEESAEKTERDYRVGTMQVLFQNQAEIGDDEYAKVHVLHDQNSDTVWVNGSEFEGYLDNYSYYYNEEEKTAEIWVRNRQIGFQTGGSVVGYKIGENECFYRMDEPVVKYDDEVWIPAEDFFYYLGCNTVPIAKDGDTSEWIPTEDYLLVMNPQKTVIDVLEEIFARDNGAYWLFDYEKDFAQYSENVDAKFEKAKDALGLYETLTLDLERLADNIGSNAGRDIFYDYMEENFGVEVVDFDAKEGIEEFIDRMLNPSESLIRAGEDHIGAALEIAEQALETVDTSTDYMEEIVGAIDSAAGNLQDLLKNDYDEIKGLISNSKKLENVIDTGTLAASVGLEIFGVLQRIVNHDESVLKAMDYYLDLTNVEGNIYKELKLQFAERSNDYIYAAYESTMLVIKESAEKIIEEMLKKAGFSAVSFVGSMNNLLWYAIEQTGWASMEKLNRVVIDLHIGDTKFVDIDTDTSLATVDEAKAMRMSVYGIMYEMDALNELSEYYYDILVGNGMRNYSELTACAYLALNYLQSCYVTTEAALSAFAHANVEDTENTDEEAWISYRTKKFADTDLYKNTQKKNEQIAEMLTILTEALPYGTDMELSLTDAEAYEESMDAGQKAIRDRLFGVIMNSSDFSANELTYEVFITPSTMENGKSYGYRAPLLESPERVILPLVNFDEVINNGGKFVGFNENIYYWNFNENSLGTDGVVGNFEMNKEVKNQLMCRTTSGKETVVCEDVSTGTIFISGNIIYYEQTYANWAACDMEGNPAGTYPSITICGADVGRGLVVGTSYENGLTVISSQGTVTTVAGTDAAYIGINDGILYYETTTDSTTLNIFAYDLDKKTSVNMGSITTDDLALDYLPGIWSVDSIFDENCMYLLVGCYQGTGLFFEGCVYRINYEGGMKKVVSYAVFPKIYLEIKENGERILYYNDTEAYSNVGHGDSYVSNGVKALNLETGAVSETDLVLSHVNDAVRLGDGIQSLLGNDAVYTEIVSPELLERMKYSDLNEEISGQAILIRDLDIVGNMAYVTLGRMYEDSTLSVGWRTGYRRDSFETFAVEIGTTKAVKLDTF